jgi:hypothetical protein
MRKQSPNTPELTDEDLAFEMIEVTSDEIQSLARVFDMISDLCEDLQQEVDEESQEDLPKRQLH